MLYANGGAWNGHQVIPDMPPFDAYTYLWWLDRLDDVVWTDGWVGQFVIVGDTSTEPSDYCLFVPGSDSVESAKRAKMVRDVATAVVALVEPPTRIDICFIQAR